MPRRPRPHARTALAVVGAILLVGALGAGPASAADVTVQQVTGNLFSPASVTIDVGDTVTWVNADAVAPHTVTANDSSFDSGLMANGATYSRTFTSPGTYAYRCTFHPPGMVGTVTVRAAATQPPAPTATAGGAPAGTTAAPTLPTSSTAIDIGAGSGDSTGGIGGIALALIAGGIGFLLADRRHRRHLAIQREEAVR
jgi:plastocyanin